jgi:hypothetical protein
MTDSHQWGWVDPDGTVHVRLPAGGDAVVGQYAAGDAATALEFFGRKYLDAVADVRLARERLQSGTGTPDQAEAVVAKVRAAVAAPPFVGDLAGLSHAADALHTLAAERRLTTQAEKARQKAEALASRSAIAAEAEQLADSVQWKATSERFRELVDQWKALPRFDKRAEQELWQRFSEARSRFDKARKTHFAQRDAERGAAREAKQAIIAEAEALAGSTEWAEGSRKFRELMDRWKAAPRAARDEEDRLWQRFQAARDAFFGARNAQQAVRDAGQEHNLQAKEGLLARAEALLPVADAGAARAALNRIGEEWDAIGHVPREAKAGIEARLRRVGEEIGKAERKAWQRTDPAMRERAETTVRGFTASVAKLEAELEKARAAGNARAVAAAESSLVTTRSLLEAAQRVLAEYSG